MSSNMQLSPNLAEQSMEKVRPNEGGVLIQSRNGVKLHIISLNFEIGLYLVVIFILSSVNVQQESEQVQ